MRLESGVVPVGFPLIFPKVKFLRIRNAIFEAKFYLIVTLSEFLPRAISDSLNY